VEWIEVRSTRAGVLDDLAVEELATHDAAPRAEGVVSLVADRPSASRAIPMVYLDRMPLFGSRDLAEATDRLERIAAAVLGARATPTYVAQSCALEHRRGLYLRETHNRGTFRMRLQRLGVEFEGEQFVSLRHDASFGTASGVLSPDFLIIGADGDNGEEAVSPSSAQMIFVMAGLRLGPLTPSELATLTAALRNAAVVGAADPQVVVEALRAQP